MWVEPMMTSQLVAAEASCRPHLRVGHPSHYEYDDSWFTSLDRGRSCCLCTDEMKKTLWLYIHVAIPSNTVCTYRYMHIKADLPTVYVSMERTQHTLLQ